MNLAQFAMALFTFSVYNALMGWKIALLLMFGVAFHENCHLWMAKKQGLPTGGFYLFPFVGGVALMTGRYKTLWQQSLVVLAGPLGGGLMACLFSVAYFITGSKVLGASALWMLVMNLFNLLPLSFMDGGQLMGTIVYSFGRKLGLIVKCVSTLAAVLLLIHWNPVLAILVMLFGGMEINREFRDYTNLKNGKSWLVSDSYLYPPTKLSKKQIILTVGGHLGTAVLLGAFTMITMRSLDLTSFYQTYSLLK